MKIYHVETQQTYNELMTELEEKGCKWKGGEKPTNYPVFKRYGKNTYIYDEYGVIQVSSGEYFKEHYSNEPVIEYKAKGENMKIYQVETQQNYDILMVELEEKGYKWLSGNKPTSKDYWKSYKENTCIVISSKYITFMNIEQSKKQHPNIPTIEYKAKGEKMKMTQEEMKRNIFDWARDVSVAVESFARGMYEAEADLQEAKSSTKKLIEKIDDYFETLKPKFKVGDYVTVYVNRRTLITKIDKLTENKSEAHGLWYDRELVNFKQDYWYSSGVNKFRHARPSEIAEYEAALQFHKNGRKPFEVKEGDILRDDEGNILINDESILRDGFPKNLKKNYFTSGRYTFLKTAEEVNEWLENK